MSYQPMIIKLDFVTVTVVVVNHRHFRHFTDLLVVGTEGVRGCSHGDELQTRGSNVLNAPAPALPSLSYGS